MGGYLEEARAVGMALHRREIDEGAAREMSRKKETISRRDRQISELRRTEYERFLPVSYGMLNVQTIASPNLFL